MYHTTRDHTLSLSLYIIRRGISHHAMRDTYGRSRIGATEKHNSGAVDVPKSRLIRKAQVDGKYFGLFYTRFCCYSQLYVTLSCYRGGQEARGEIRFQFRSHVKNLA